MNDLKENSVGSKIKKLREERNVSQTALAEAAGITLATLNRFEQNKISVTVKTLQKILDVFGLEISFKKRD